MRVICEKALTCTRDSQCGAKKPHNDSSCEPCPFNDVAVCVEVKTKLCFEGEEHELKPCPDFTAEDAHHAMTGE